MPQCLSIGRQYYQDAGIEIKPLITLAQFALELPLKVLFITIPRAYVLVQGNRGNFSVTFLILIIVSKINE